MDQNLLPLTAFISIFSAVGALLFAMRDVLLPSRNKNQTLRQQMRNLPNLRDGKPTTAVAKFDRWFTLLAYQNGLRLSTTSMALFIIIGGGVVGVFAWAGTDNMIVALAAGLVGSALTLAIIAAVRRRRMTKFETEFPDAIDILARAVRAGESLEQSVELVASAVKDPVAGEFRRCSRHLEMGLGISATMQSFADRIDQSDVRIFCSTVSIHREGGGNLAESMDRLARLVRDRLDYRRQMKSSSSAGRFSIMVIFILAPLLLAYLFIFRPEYGLGLWNDPIGRWMLVLSVAGQMAGLFWVSRILKLDY